MKLYKEMTKNASIMHINRVGVTRVIKMFIINNFCINRLEKEVVTIIIDAHNHPDWHGHNLEKFLANMKKYNIDKTWILSWEAPFDEYDPYTTNCFPVIEQNGPVPFARCLSYIERAPEKFILGYAPDPRKPQAIDMLRKYPNLYCDMSAYSGYNALKRDPEFAKDFLLEFQNRILYARDYFDNVHQEFLNSLGLPMWCLKRYIQGML